MVVSVLSSLAALRAVAYDESDSLVADRQGFERVVLPFFRIHCAKCHGDEVAESELKLDKDFSINLQDPTVKQEWSEIVDVLNSHEMPPDSEVQPKPDEVAAVVDWASLQIRLADSAKLSSRTVIRRLNRTEYRNTIRDLVGIRFDTDYFPMDPLVDGFDNNGNSLTVSPMHMEIYFDAARKILDEAIVEGKDSPGKAPEVVRIRFEPEVGNGDHSRVKYGKQNPIVHGGKNPTEDGFTVMHHNHWDRHANARDFTVPQAGWYKVRVRAGGLIPDRDEVVRRAESYLKTRLEDQLKTNPNGEKWHREAYDRDLEHFKTSPIYRYGPPRLKLIQSLSGQPVVISEFDVTGSKASPSIHESLVRFDANKTGLTLEYAYSVPSELENFWMQNQDDFARPVVYLDWFEIEGPFFDSWPPASHTKTLGKDVTSNLINRLPNEAARKSLASFMRRAFRRPVLKEEVDQKMKLFEAGARDGKEFYEAIKLPLTSVLCSPNFLYLAEPIDAEIKKPVKLRQHELATRLSYFLWSSMPDEELMRAASHGKLNQTEEIVAQVDRMLQDPRVEQFVVNFSDQWLGLREVGSNPPVPQLYPEYDRHLEESMIEEGHAFVREILKGDLSILNFVSSDFVTVNERLGRFYGIDEVRGDAFVKVQVPKGVHRGGIVTLSAVHTITSNGTRTSPVKRGTWVLKNVLGTDPGLPVANAGDIAPKVPGIDKATVRQRLEIHRTLPQCARCHNKIDPLGFALENYNTAGKWREQEGFGYNGRIQKKDPVIDASSQLPDGTKIEGVDGLRRALLKASDLFIDCLAKKLFTYALGREVGIPDQPTIKQANQYARDHAMTMRSLIHFIVGTEAFQTK
jgi:hypothetical protein